MPLLLWYDQGTTTVAHERLRVTYFKGRRHLTTTRYLRNHYGGITYCRIRNEPHYLRYFSIPTPLLCPAPPPPVFLTQMHYNSNSTFHRFIRPFNSRVTPLFPRTSLQFRTVLATSSFCVLFFQGNNEIVVLMTAIIYPIELFHQLVSILRSTIFTCLL